MAKFRFPQSRILGTHLLGTTTMRPFVILISILAIFAWPPAATAFDSIVVVRHAEKADDGTRDPALSRLGQDRAEALARVLRESDVTGLIASNYQRTQQTLGVVAEQHGLSVTIVPAEAGKTDAHIKAVVAAARASHADGILVVAGHSNTVPQIVQALSGRKVADMDESEYDRLFLLLPAASGMNVIEARYGARSAAMMD